MNFIFQRIVLALVTLFLVSLLCFLAFSVIRGDPASLVLGTGAGAEQLAALREELGLEQGLVKRYCRWLGDFITGNPGTSIRFSGEPISAMIRSRLRVSFSLALFSLLLILGIAVPVSLLSVRPGGSAVDRAVTVFTALGISVPGFFLGLLFIWVFGVGAGFFRAGLYVDYRESFAGFAGGLFFPALAIAIPNAAALIKFLRSSLYKELQSDYVRTARGKGAGTSLVLRRHVLRNALLPSITVTGMIIAEIFSGSIIIEQVFAIPGIGRLLIAAITSRDYPLIQALVVYIASVVIIANALADIAIQIIDPRIRLERPALQ